jgi:hypothetical protein
MLTGANMGCANSGELNQYMGGRMPTDKTRTHCSAIPGVYGIGTGTVYGSVAVAISASLESASMGNTGGVLTSFQTGSQTMNLYSSFNKGTGSGYVIAR